jgi:LmbE family N-acetylglucosaminyl deacetylase
VWQKLAACGAVAPFVLAGGTSGAFYLRWHYEAAEQTVANLPPAPVPAPGRRILVLSPHCDDETLGVGATIADARRKGVPVTVAFFTNGDGFRVAAGRELNEVSVAPADFVRFAERRQQESLRADRKLGVAPGDVVFLGYPDRGLRPMWEDHWSAADPFRSGFTGHTHSPYPRTYTPRTPYAGSAVLSDLVRLMRQVKPTDVYVTHPADDHPDHSAAASFAQAALLSLRGGGAASDAWARDARVHYYIVHRGDWPLPQGRHPNAPLAPPPGLAESDTRWAVYRPSAEARAAKAAALNEYRSQLRITGRFLNSFLRANELVGELPEPTVMADGAPAHVRDAAQDDVARYVDAAADLTGLTVQERVAGSSAVDVRLFTRGPVSPRVRYTLLLKSRHAGGAAGGDAFSILRLPVTAASSGGGLGAGNTLTVTVPREKLGPGADCLWVSAETRYPGTGKFGVLPPVDRIGYRPFRLAAPPQKLVLRTAKD